MSNSVYALLLALLSIAGPAQPAEPVVVDVGNGESLLPFFEAGLRPRHATLDDGSMCEMRETSIRFVVDDAVLPPFEPPFFTITVQGNGRMSSVGGQTNSMTIGEAIDYLLPFYEALGHDAATLLDLERRVTEWNGSKSPPGAGLNLKFGENGTLRIGTGTVSRATGPAKTQARMIISWRTKIRDFVAPTGPIQPPPGYEHVSMEPYPLIRNGRNLWERRTPNPSAGQFSNPGPETDNSSAATATGNQNPSGRGIFWLLLAGLFLVAATSLTICRIRHHHRMPGN